MLKSGIGKTLFLSLLVVKSSLAMDSDEGPQKKALPKVAVQAEENPLLKLPLEGFYNILHFLSSDPKSFSVFKQTSQASYKMAEEMASFKEAVAQIHKELSHFPDFFKRDIPTKQMAVFFHKKWIRLCEDEISLIRADLKKAQIASQDPNEADIVSSKDDALKEALQEAIEQTNWAYTQFSSSGEASEEETAECFLKQGALYEETGHFGTAAYMYKNAVDHIENKTQKEKWLLKSASLFEELGNQRMAACTYHCIVEFFENKTEKAALFLKVASLYEGADDMAAAKRFYLKAAALYKATGDRQSAEKCRLKG